jgi:RimJ/RimL family protein N-acetyltransferase
MLASPYEQAAAPPDHAGRGSRERAVPCRPSLAREERTHVPHTITLREVVESDLPAFFEHQLDPEATRMAAFPSRDEGAFYEHWKKILVNPDVVTRTILQNGAVVGNVGHFVKGGEPLVGYWIGRAYWGRGIATRGLALFLDVVKRRPLFARVAKHNLGSIRVLEKCGFTVIGAEIEPAEPGAESIEEFVMKLEAKAR